MAHEKQSLGQAIDQVIQALEPLDESARKTAIGAVCVHLGIKIADPMSAGRAQPVGGAIPQNAVLPASTVLPQTTHVDIRSLKAEKKPTSAAQMACLVAYYLQEHAPDSERKQAITTADIDKYFKQAGFKLPQRSAQLLPDTKAAGYFDSGGRGEYKLNAVGYNLVVHNLPAKSAAG